MMLRNVSRAKSWGGVVVAAILVVALACGGEEPTATSPPPTATSAPTATSPAPTATTPAVESTPEPGQPTATAAPMIEPTATAVPEVVIDEADWVAFLKAHRGYKPEWGEPQYGGTIKMSGPRPVSRWLGGYMGWGAFASGFGGIPGPEQPVDDGPLGIHQGCAHL